MSQPTNKAMKILQLIKAGGATNESLMAGAEVNKAGLASQLSYLNTRGLNIAEVDRAKAEFPMKGEDGVYVMVGIDAYEAKRASGSGIGAKKPMTSKEIVEHAQKREDKASAAATKANDRLEADPSNLILALRAKIADANLELASALLAAAERGDFSNENVTLKDDDAVE